MKFSIIRKSIYYRKQALDYLLMKRKWDSDVQLHFGFRVNMEWKSFWWQLCNLLVAKLSQLEDSILDIIWICKLSSIFFLEYFHKTKGNPYFFCSFSGLCFVKLCRRLGKVGIPARETFQFNNRHWRSL